MTLHNIGLGLMYWTIASIVLSPIIVRVYFGPRQFIN